MSGSRKARPKISPATPGVGDLLSASAGGWSGSPSGFTYQWQRCNADGSNASDIVGATTNQYTVSGADAGRAIRVGVTATYAGHPSSLQYSLPTTTVLSTGGLSVSVSTAVSHSEAPTVTVSAAPSGGAYWGATVSGNAYGGSNAGYGSSAPWSTPASNDTSWNLFETHTGKAMSMSSFHLDLGGWNSDPFTHSRSRGCFGLFISALETTVLAAPVTLAKIASGVYDTQLGSWANSVAAFGQPMMFRPWWEMNGTWYAWGDGNGITGNAPTDYIAAWQHFKTLCDSHGATNLTWCWCPNVWGSGSSNPGLQNPFTASWYPGDSYVDWFGLDGYNKAASTNSFDNIFGPAYAAMTTQAPTKPIVICETAAHEYATSTVKPNWITDAYAKIKASYPQIKAVSWYNNSNGSTTDGSGATDTFPIECSTVTPGIFTGTSASSAAFATAIGDSYYKANIVNSTTFPSGAKVPVP